MGEKQEIDGVNLDTVLRSIVLKNDDTDELAIDGRSNPLLLTGSVIFTQNSRVAVSKGGTFEFGPNATFNKMNVTRCLSKALAKDRALDAETVVVNGVSDIKHLCRGKQFSFFFF